VIIPALFFTMTFNQNQKNIINRVSRLSEINLFLLAIFSVLLVGFILRPMKDVMVPIIVAGFLHILFSPIIVFLKRKKVPNFLATALTFILLFVILQTVGIIIYTSFGAFMNQLPEYGSKISLTYKQLLNQFPFFSNIVKHSFLSKFDETNSLSQMITMLFNSIIGFGSRFFLILIIFIFLQMSEGSFTKKINIAYHFTYSWNNVIRGIKQQVFSYLLTKSLISFFTGLGAYIILVIYGVDFAIIWGVLTFILNFIPNIGSIIATLLPAIQTLVQFGDLMIPFWILMTLTFLQMIMGNILDPYLTGESLDMSPVTVLISLIFWGWLWGIQGMFIGIPITAIIKIICKNVPSLQFIDILMSNKITEIETPSPPSTDL